MEILNNIVCINLDISIWSGLRRIKRQDLEDIVGGALPPDKLLSLGSKRIIDPQLLLRFRMLRQRAERLLGTFGTRFLGGWAIPRDRLEQVLDGLRELQGEFDRSIEDFIATYETAVQEWMQQFPGWESILSRGLLSAAEVRQRFGFRWQAFEVNPPEGDAAEGLQQEIGKLPNRVLREIAQWADEIWEESFAGKSEISRKALRPLGRMEQKLRGLACINPICLPLADLIASALKRVPSGKGKLSELEMGPVYRVLHILSKPERMKIYAEKGMEGLEDDGGFGILMGTESVDAEDADEAPIAEAEGVPEAPVPEEEPETVPMPKVVGMPREWF